MSSPPRFLRNSKANSTTAHGHASEEIKEEMKLNQSMSSAYLVGLGPVGLKRAKMHPAA